MTDTATSDTAPAGRTSVEFNYQKSPDYRSIHVDGAAASTTPKGYAAITFYNERGVLPRLTRRPIIDQAGELSITLGDEESVSSLHDVMRQIETTIFVDLSTAVEMRDLLDRLIQGMQAQENAKSQDKLADSK